MTAIPLKIFRVCTTDIQATISRYEISCCSIIDFVEFEDKKMIKINAAWTDCDLINTPKSFSSVNSGRRSVLRLY